MYVTRLFNAYCSENGVQCTVTMDPMDYRQVFHFKNVGDRLVRITHQGQCRFLEPGEYVTMAVNAAYDLSAQDSLPEIVALNGALG